MKAVFIRSYGGPEVLEVGELPDPKPGPGDVLVAVEAASLNPIDWKTREGLLRARFELNFPRVLGRDFGGKIVAVGPDVKGFQPGDAVFGAADRVRDGAQATLIVTPARHVSWRPNGMDSATAAALALAGASALAGVEETAPVQKGMRVLIHAGAGGVGHLAVQFCRWRGAHVIATASAGNAEFVKAQGAHEVVDYRAQDFAAVVRDCDVVFDTMGGEVYPRSLACLKPGGTLAFLNAAPIPRHFPRADVSAKNAPVLAETRHLDRLAEYWREGALKPHVSATFPLARAREAFALSQSGRARGKIVLLPG